MSLPLNQIICGDCIEVMKEFPSNNIDCVVTDPPYGISFMGKEWDRALPPKEAFKQMFRVLKPGALAFVMSSPRQDVLWRMLQMLEDVGFELKQSFISWIFKSGFPKAYDVSKGIDKKFGLKRKVVGKNPHHRISVWSGGKDSTVALHLALRYWKDAFTLVFVDTGITLPETLEFIDKLKEEWSLKLTVLKPNLNFWDYVAKNGFPRRDALWCRRLLKVNPIKDFLKKIHGWKVEVLGVRREESVARRKSLFYRKPFRLSGEHRFSYTLNPILNWTKQQVETYIHRFQIPVNPAYKLYGRSGCYYCPFVTNPRYYLTLKRLHPGLFQKITEAEKVMRKGKAALYANNKQIFIHKLEPQQFLGPSSKTLKG